MDYLTIIDKAAQYVKLKLFDFEEGGHDWLHTYRVWQTTKLLAMHTKCNKTVAELGALFHDIADAKFTNGDETIAIKLTENWLQQEHLGRNIISAVLHIVKHVSWRKQYEFDAVDYPELAIVQDADRLDAIGAIGIARAFSYGGFAKRPIIVPSSEVNQLNDMEDTISHFYEKLLHIKDSLHTKHAKAIAYERHEFMLQFLNQIQKEVSLSSHDE